SDQPQATKLELYVGSSDQAQDYLDRKWASMYEGVRRANATIQFLEKVSRLKPIEISRADSMGIRGEALFLRAHYHFEAWRMWGNIPYYFDTDTTPVVQGGFRKANNLGADSVPKLIIADLNAAIALLPDKPRNGQAGRVTSWGARAYKGRVLVYMHQYAAAVATLDSVVTSNAFGVETSFDVVWTGFHGFTNGTDTVDPRLDWTIGRDSVPYKDWGMHSIAWIRAPGYGGRYSPKKNAQEKASGAVSKVGWQPEQENGVHIHIFRYADMLLLDAEAKVETNDLAGAQAIVNQIRARAAVAAQGCGAGSSNAALVAKYPVCTNDDRIAVPLTDPSI